MSTPSLLMMLDIADTLALILERSDRRTEPLIPIIPQILVILSSPASPCC
jgi:hypothetical protein